MNLVAIAAQLACFARARSYIFQISLLLPAASCRWESPKLAVRATFILARPTVQLSTCQCLPGSFRNEISPGQFLFRTREFEQMELVWTARHLTAAVSS